MARKSLPSGAVWTVNYTSHGHAKYFFLPTFSSSGDAQLRAADYAQDDLFEELPVAVVDLDTGDSYRADYRSVGWSYAKSES